MNFFSSPEYLDAVRRVYAPRARRQAVQSAGQTFFVLCDKRRVLDDVPFLDFFEPAEAAGASATPFLRAVALHTVSAEEFSRGGFSQTPSPFIDWSLFSSWEDFTAAVAARAPKPNPIAAQAKRWKLLERDFSPLVFSFDDRESDALSQIITWKSAQYTHSGFVDLFADKRHVRMFEALLTAGLLTISTLRAAGKLVAGHVGVVHEARFYYWLPAYDAAFAKQSVGAVLLQRIVEESFQRKHREFDFLVGNESYKWAYATHVRLVAPLGTPPFRARVYGAVRAQLIAQVKKQKWIYARLQAAKRAAKMQLAKWRK